jgi:C1A family cysteine protease
MPRKIAGYGWIPQLPDLRDARLAVPKVTSLPESVDMSKDPAMPPIYDQGQLGSCTANAIAAAVDFENHRQNGLFITPSRLWIYYQERVIEGSVREDAGASLRDGMKSVSKLGVCPETDWPYDIDTFADKPPQTDYASALKDKVLLYEAAPQELFALKSLLASGLPIVFGFSVYESFESKAVAKTGVIPMPSPTESMIGGHACVLVGYNDAHDRFLVRNSWGTDWGNDGYFEMPYQYPTSALLASDFWAVQTTSVGAVT